MVVPDNFFCRTNYILVFTLWEPSPYVPVDLAHLPRQSRSYHVTGGRHRDIRQQRRSWRWRHRTRLLLRRRRRRRRRRPRTACEVHAAMGNNIPGSLHTVERAVSRFIHERSSRRGVGLTTEINLTKERLRATGFTF